MGSAFNGIKVALRVPELSSNGTIIPLDKLRGAVQSKSGEPVPLYYSNSRGMGEELGHASLEMEGDQLTATLEVHSDAPDLFFDDSSPSRAIYDLISTGSLSPSGEITNYGIHGVSMTGVPVIRRGVVIKGTQGLVMFLETDLDAIIDIDDTTIFGDVGDYTVVVVDVTHKLGLPQSLHVTPLGETTVKVKQGTPIRSLPDRASLLSHILMSYQDRP